ncbi:MAG: hypothetical protein ACLGIG_10310 [Actinomycetes bacterium]
MEDLVLWIIAEIWLLALVVATVFFVGVVGAQASTRRLRSLRARVARSPELTSPV